MIPQGPPTGVVDARPKGVRRRVVLLMIALTTVLVVAIFGLLWIARGAGQPQRDGVAAIPGLDGEIVVRWDAAGVPYVEARSEADLAAALGWLHANDRITQMTLGRRAAYGTLAASLGAAMRDTDVYFHRLDLPARARRSYAQASPRTRRWLEGYARGINAWCAARGTDLPPGMRLLGGPPDPWQPEDGLIFALLMARDLSFWSGRPEERRLHWLAAFGIDGVRDLLDDSSVVEPPGLEPFLTPLQARIDAAQTADSLQTADSPQTADSLQTARRSAVDRADPQPRLAHAIDRAIDEAQRGGLDGGLGSNNWALGPTRTARGGAVVANDPHLGLHLPATWYQIHLRAPGFEAAGLTLPGAPSIVIGRGPSAAWALTNVMLDDHDLYLETLNDDGTAVRRAEGWQPLETRTITIAVRGGDSETITVAHTDLGPLLPAEPERGLPARSLRWIADDLGDPLAALLTLAEAETADDVLGALDSFITPTQNLVVALRDGTVLHTVLGLLPERRFGDGRLPMPAAAPDAGWAGLRARSANPTVVLPPRAAAPPPVVTVTEGEVSTAKAASANAASPDGASPDAAPRADGAVYADDVLVTANHDIRSAGSARYLVGDFYIPHRATRIAERLLEADDWTPATIAALQTDTVSVYARQILQRLRRDADALPADARAVLDRLDGWHGDLAADGAAAAPAVLYVYVERALRRAVFDDERIAADLSSLGGRAVLLAALDGRSRRPWLDDVSTPDVVETRVDAVARALEAGYADAITHMGDDPAAWSYGALHPLMLRHRLDAVPVLGRWLRRGPYPLGGDGTTVAAWSARWRGDRLPIRSGPSMRWVMDWADPDRAWAMLPGGQSGHGADVHYDDQIDDFLSGQLRPMPWTSAGITAATDARPTLTLRPADGAEDP
ncbi:MAG: penicillin acylase family protein [Acidobacteriota bacterium]